MVDISGWAFCRTAPVSRIELRMGNRAPVEATIGLPRPDVVEAYAGDPVDYPGFSGRVISTDSGPVTLSVRATAADGSTATVIRKLEGTAATRLLRTRSAFF